MLFAAIPLALSIGLIFSVPQFQSPWTLFAYVLIILIVLRGAVRTLKYFWSVSSETTSRIFILRVVGMACAIPLYTALPKRMEKRDTLIAAIIVGSSVQFLLPLLAIAGLLPNQGATLTRCYTQQAS